MCWNGEASVVLSIVGVAGTAYAAYKKEPSVLWMALGYFTLMEILQAYTYTVIGQCHDPANQIATLLGYLHIVFQPFFINAVSLHFINQNIAKKIAPFVYTLCFAASIMMLIKLYPFTWANVGNCPAWIPMCGNELCSIHGNWHIAWSIPLNEFGAFRWYVLTGFIVSILYGSWRFTIYHILAGPLLAFATTQNMNEWPAVWCLLSIGFLLIVVKTPVRGILYVERTYYQRWWLRKNK